MKHNVSIHSEDLSSDSEPIQDRDWKSPVYKNSSTQKLITKLMGK